MDTAQGADLLAIQAAMLFQMGGFNSLYEQLRQHSNERLREQPSEHREQPSEPREHQPPPGTPKMAELFIRSHLKVPYKTHPSQFDQDGFVRCAVEAPFTVSEMRRIFGAPNLGPLPFCPPNADYWQFRRAQEQTFLTVVLFQGEDCPTIFSTGINALREFLVFMEEGVDALRVSYGHAC